MRSTSRPLAEKVSATWKRSVKPKPSVLKWLLDSDPAIRWQVMRDLVHEPAGAVAAERARVGVEGWGAALLARQSPTEGNWEGDRKHWMRTIHTLVVLKNLGLDPKGPPARRAIKRILDKVTWWQLDGRPFFDGETEPCLNGHILALGAYFGHPSKSLLKRLLAEQLEDGGWNCNAPPSTRSSFHTTICVLEGLLEYEQSVGPSAAVTKARRRAEKYLLERHLFRSLSTGEIIDRKWLRFTFPTTWHYDVLRGLDYLRRAGVTPDERIAEALAVVRKRGHQNGRWPMNHLHADRIDFDLETGVGRASRWNTLRAYRVLDWATSGER